MSWLYSIEGSPADAGDQLLGPDRWDHKEGLCSWLGLDVLFTGDQVVQLPMVLLVESVWLGGLHYLTGHQARMDGTKAIHGLSQTVGVAIVGRYVGLLVAPMWRGTARAVASD